MGYRTADFNCPECESSRIVMFERSEGPGTQSCRICGTEMIEGFPAPTVMRAGFAEGQERGERWTMLKQSAKLEQEASVQRKNGNHEAYREMTAESKKLSKRAASKRDKTDV